MGILCVAFAAFIFLVGVASPKAYEGFDLTVRGPIKKIVVHDMDPTMEADQSESAVGERGGNDEDASQAIGTVGGDENAAAVEDSVEMVEGMDASLHA